MKKTILFYSALFFTVAGIAQTNVKSQQTATGASQVQKQPGAVTLTGAGSASAATAVQSDAMAEAAGNTKAELTARKRMISSEKKQAEGKVNNSVEQAAAKEVGAKASVNASSKVNAGNDQAGLHADGELSSGSTVSLNKVKDQGVEVKKEGEAHIENKTNTTLQKTTEVTTAARTKVVGTTQQTSGVAAGTATKVVTAVKVKPAPIKVNTRVTTAAGIQLR